MTRYWYIFCNDDFMWGIMFDLLFYRRCSAKHVLKFVVLLYESFCFKHAVSTHQLKLFQKGVFYSGIKTYNHLPKTIKELSHDVKQFRLALKRFIISDSFYSLEEYFDINWKWVMFGYTGYTAPCKMACWLLTLKLFIYLTCIKFHYCTLLTLLIRISHKFIYVYTVCCCFFFWYYYRNDCFHIL
jgi:hypothetical protein